MIAALSPLRRTNLTKTSGLLYNSLGGISSTPLATMPRPSSATSTSSTGISPTANAQTTAAYQFQTKSLSQSQLEKDLIQRSHEPITEQGLYARLQYFDDYNKLGGRKGLREVMEVKWLHILEFTQGVSVPDDSREDCDLRIFLEIFSFFHKLKISDWNGLSRKSACSEGHSQLKPCKCMQLHSQGISCSRSRMATMFRKC